MASQSDDFFAAYFNYLGETEAPIFFHRWSVIAAVGALLERNYYLHHGHFVVNPNMYVMLIGDPGTRKSTAIKMVKRLLAMSGYTTFSADKTTKEKFLLDLSGAEFDETGKEILSSSQGDALVAKNLWGADVLEETPAAQMFIAADEFNEFMGNGNIEFISLLGNLWDYSGIFKNRIKNGKSVSINDPTVSILGGNTPTGFSLAFPPESLGQGFFSRLILIAGQTTGKKIAFPSVPPPEATTEIVERLAAIKHHCKGSAKIGDEAVALLTEIYEHGYDIDDFRFVSYSSRRFTHLLKLCLIVSATRMSTEITVGDVVYANTILVHTERQMPKALGEFGKSRNSDVTHSVLKIVEAAPVPISMNDIWKQVSKDLDKMQTLGDIIRSLLTAEKIQNVNGKFLPNKKIFSKAKTKHLDFSLLHPQELEVV